MKTLSPAANDIVLIVINDGNGSQCGMTYDQRCNAVDIDNAAFYDACKKANQWRIKNECPSATNVDIRAAVEEIRAYYRQHKIERQS